MQIKIACVGKLKDRFYLEAAAEYAGRLSRFCTLGVCEVADERIAGTATPGQERMVRDKEGARLLRNIRDNEYVVALCVEGARFTSEAFAARLKSLAESGHGAITFVIGGSIGLSDAVLARANARVSLSDMTMPHRLCRVFLLEQLYRACKIHAHETYHK